MVYETSRKANESLVVAYNLLITINSLVHMVRINDGVGIIVIKNHSRDGSPSLCRLRLQLLSLSWVVDNRDLPRMVHG